MCFHLTSLYRERFIRGERHKLMYSFVNAPCGISVRGHEPKTVSNLVLASLRHRARCYGGCVKDKSASDRSHGSPYYGFVVLTVCGKPFEGHKMPKYLQSWSNIVLKMTGDLSLPLSR